MATVSASELRKIDQRNEDPAGWSKLNLYRYPENLGSTEEPHYVTFEINIRGKSSQYKKSPSKIRYEIKKDSQTAAELDTSAASLRTAAAAAAGAATGIAITGLSNKISKAINASGQLSAASKTVGTLAGLGSGAAVGSAVLLGEILQPDKIYRITDHVALQLDGPPSVRYAMNYTNKDLGTLLGILAGSSFEAQTVGGGITSATQALGLSLAKLPGAFGAGDLAGAIGKAAGIALNPFREVIFEAVDFRSFNFKYKFLPKSKNETEQIRNIIELFKYHMHPELHESKLFFVYPSEFQITYWYKRDENPYLFKFRPVVLENMDVTYGGETFSSFNDGAPTEINLTLTFRETEIITKNLIDKGGA